MAEIKVVNIKEKFSLFHEYWQPKVVGGLNQQQVKLAKLKGAFDMHFHENEDELFLVIEGTLKMELQQKTLTIDEGEFVIIPKGTWHRPIAENEVKVLLFEPAGTRNTGNLENGKTIDKLDHI